MKGHRQHPKPFPKRDLEAIVSYINSEPMLISFLYDCDLLPEQIQGDAHLTDLMILLACSFKAGKDAAILLN